MVEFQDTSIIAQLGTPDMRVPIQYALTYPDRMPLPSGNRLNLAAIGQLHFNEMDRDRFRCLQFAYTAGKVGGTMPTVLNAANEAAVSAFLEGKIRFLQIEDLIEKALSSHQPARHPDLKLIQEVDRETRQFVNALV
jgi:1-deoxy-D-xylulose-5-phosphate reductoisomerase